VSAMLQLCNVSLPCYRCVICLFTGLQVCNLFVSHVTGVYVICLSVGFQVCNLFLCRIYPSVHLSMPCSRCVICLFAVLQVCNLFVCHVTGV